MNSLKPSSSRLTWFRLSACGLVLSAVTSVQPGDAASDSLTVTVGGLRNDQGQVGCVLFASADGFPKQPEKAAARQFVRITPSKTATCFFDAVKPGTIAIAVIHDENGNGKLDKNILGIPTEGFGASRDARGRFGPPSFGDAAFTFAGGSMQIAVTVRY